MINREAITIRDKVYLVHRKLKDETKWDVEILKKLWNCSHAFHNQGILYLCKEIEDIEYEVIS